MLRPDNDLDARFHIFQHLVGEITDDQVLTLAVRRESNGSCKPAWASLIIGQVGAEPRFEYGFNGKHTYIYADEIAKTAAHLIPNGLEDCDALKYTATADDPKAAPVRLADTAMSVYDSTLVNWKDLQQQTRVDLSIGGPGVPLFLQDLWVMSRDHPPFAQIAELGYRALDLLNKDK